MVESFLPPPTPKSTLVKVKTLSGNCCWLRRGEAYFFCLFLRMGKTNWLGARSWSQTISDKLTGQLLISSYSGQIVRSLYALSDVLPTEWPMGPLGACLPSEKQGEALLPCDPCGPLRPPTCQAESLGAYIPKQLSPNLQQTPKQTPHPLAPNSA